MIRIRLTCAAVLLALAGCARGSAMRPSPACTDFRRDFDVLWTTLRDHYAYFDEKQVDWERVRAVYAPAADTVSSKRSLLLLLERVLEELYDPHTSLRANTARSPRIVPTGIDLWAEWRAGAAVVTQVRPGFSAEQAGIRPGMRIVAINGVPVDSAAQLRLGVALRGEDDASRAWALLSALAGRHDTPRTIRARTADGREIDFRLDLPQHQKVDSAAALPVVESRELPGGIGYIRLNDLGDSRSVAAFDSAIDRLRPARGLILDLRNTPGGGNTGVAEPILGRFIDRRHGYQRVIPRGGQAYVRQVDPRGPWTYTAPLVVLAGRWTGSMGEGMAIGLDGIGRATVVGTRMAGLAGAVEEVTLPCSGLRAGYPAARLEHVDGTPRERWVPTVLVDPVSADSTADDPILARGIEELRQKIADAPG